MATEKTQTPPDGHEVPCLATRKFTSRPRHGASGVSHSYDAIPPCRPGCFLSLAGLLLALRRAPPTPSGTPAQMVESTDVLRFQVSYRQQFISVQASQISTVDAKYAVLLTLAALLFQYVDGPIENTVVHWSVFVSYCAVASILLGPLAMQRVEVWTPVPAPVMIVTPAPRLGAAEYVPAPVVLSAQRAAK